MNQNKNILIKDACIIIDLIELGLFRSFLALDYVVLTTTAICLEINNDGQELELRSCLSERLLEEVPDGNILEVLALNRRYPGISYADATALELSLRTGAILLSADKLLRNSGTKEGIEVHGTLWAIVELFEAGILDKSMAIKKINQLMSINQRISISLCKKTISKIEK